MAKDLKDQGTDLLDNSQLVALVQDPLRVVDLLCKVHADECAKREISPGDFAELCTENAEVAVNAVEALVEAIADFFARLGRPALAEVTRKQRQAVEAAENKAIQTLEAMQGQTVKQIEANVETMIRESLTSGVKSGKSRDA